MKIIYKLILLGVFIATLVGCDNNVKFDRVEAFNQYAGFTQYAPTSRNIKKQTIQSYIGKFLVNTMIIEADKQGRTIKSIIEYNEESNTKIANMELITNYDDLTFDLELPIFRIYIKKGSIILDAQGRISKELSKDGEYSLFYNYKENKLIGSSMISPFFIMQDKYDWNNNLLTKERSSISNLQEESISKMETSYDYDADGKLTQSKVTGKFIDDINLTLFFDQWNEFGDWTTAKIATSNNNGAMTQTREIEYW